MLDPFGWGIAGSDEVIEDSSGHTTGRMSSRIEVVARVSGRRRWTVEQKLSILRDAFGPNGSVREALERHEIGSGQLYTWRQQAMSGTLAGVTRPSVPAFNIAERSLRGIAVGRRNWLFAGSRVGGERAADICTIIETCKLNGVDPQAYIADVIAKIANDWPAARWDELMPWNWQPFGETILAEAA